MSAKRPSGTFVRRLRTATIELLCVSPRPWLVANLSLPIFVVILGVAKLLAWSAVSLALVSIVATWTSVIRRNMNENR